MSRESDKVRFGSRCEVIFRVQIWSNYTKNKTENVAFPKPTVTFYTGQDKIIKAKCNDLKLAFLHLLIDLDLRKKLLKYCITVTIFKMNQRLSLKKPISNTGISLDSPCAGVPGRAGQPVREAPDHGRHRHLLPQGLSRQGAPSSPTYLNNGARHSVSYSLCCEVRWD